MTRDEFIQKRILEPNTYRTGYVAFLDILGFKGICRDKSCEEIKALFDEILLLKYDYIKCFANLIVPQNIVDKVEIKIISDSVIVTVPIGEDGIVFMLWFCAMLQNKMLNCGVILRGGISFGTYYVYDNTVFGPALVEAYEIEEKAVFPRIVLSKEIEHQLANKGLFRKKSVQDYVDKVSSDNHTDSNISLLIKKDSDNVYFVHYFNPIQNISLNQNTDRKNEIEHFIKANIEANQGNEKIQKKYEWLYSYYSEYAKDSIFSKFTNIKWKTEDNSNG